MVASQYSVVLVERAEGLFSAASNTPMVCALNLALFHGVAALLRSFGCGDAGSRERSAFSENHLGILRSTCKGSGSRAWLGGSSAAEGSRLAAGGNKAAKRIDLHERFTHAQAEFEDGSGAGVVAL